MYIFHFCFLNHGFKFQNSVCNGCQDLTTKEHMQKLNININDIAIINVKNVDYRWITDNISIWEVSKSWICSWSI